MSDFFREYEESFRVRPAPSRARNLAQIIFMGDYFARSAATRLVEGSGEQEQPKAKQETEPPRFEFLPAQPGTPKNEVWAMTVDGSNIDQYGLEIIKEIHRALEDVAAARLAAGPAQPKR